MTRDQILNQYRDDSKTELLTGVWFSKKDAEGAMDQYYNQAIDDALLIVKSFLPTNLLTVQSVVNDIIHQVEILKKKEQ